MKFLNGEALNEAIKKQLNPELNFVSLINYTFNRPSKESVEVINPSLATWCGLVKNGDFFVKFPRKINRPPNNSAGQNAVPEFFDEKVYNQGDTIRKKPITTSSTKCICIGNCFTKPTSVSAKIVMINCSHPMYIGINKAALETSTKLNNHGEAISVRLRI